MMSQATSQSTRCIVTSATSYRTSSQIQSLREDQASGDIVASVFPEQCLFSIICYL